MIQVFLWVVLWVIAINAIASYGGEEKMSKWVEGKELKKKVDNTAIRSKLIDDIYYCPFCGEEAYWDTDYGQQLFDYCPYCGEPMKEDGDK